MSLVFAYHPDVLHHDTGAGHPERPQRLEHVLSHLMSTPLWQTTEHLRPDEASREHVCLVHSERYVDWVADSIRRGEEVLDDGDTRVSHGSWRAALLAAGAVVKAVDVAVTSPSSHAFAAVRPPGHHAETAKAMGFCLFNSIAIGARYAQNTHGIGKVAIVDWDVHHGNGTQEIFWKDGSVLYISMHQFPLWPGTGASEESGEGAGAGTTLNCPLPPGSGEDEYLRTFEEQVVPTLRRFSPEMLLISAGFDAHRDDPLANMNLRHTSFGTFTRILLEATLSSVKAGIVSVLEGGYNLDALSRSVESHLLALTERRTSANR